MSPHLAVIAARELLLFHRITASLLLDSGPAQTCSYLYVQKHIERKYVKFTVHIDFKAQNRMHKKHDKESTYNY
jgi:queuine/archaeosine tRNA-ribosyltransferase